MANKPQKYADGGEMQAGLQPTMAIGYADGGQTGPFTSGLDANTTTFNQDYLRGPSFGSQSTSNLVSPAPTGAAAPASAPTASHGGGPSPSDGPYGTLGDAASGVANSGLAKLAASVAVPGFARMLPSMTLAAPLAQGAYNMFNGATSGVSTPDSKMSQIGANIGAGFGVGNTLSNAVFGTNLGNQASEGANPMQKDPMQLGQEKSVGLSPTGDTSAAGNYSGTGVSDSQAASNGNHSGSGDGGGTATGGNNGDASGGGDRGTRGGFADGGQLGAQNMNPAQPQQPPGPAGLQLPSASPAAPAPANMHPALANLHVQNKMANPQVLQAMKTHISQAIQAGQVNPQQLQIMGQLAQSAMQHPELWPKLREFAMQAGLPDAQHLPMQFNQGMCMALLAASQAAQHGDQPGAFANGGQLHGPGSGTSDSIAAHNTSTGQPVKLSNGEYIIPADVVATKGKEFFDSIVRKYHTPAAMQQNR